MNDKITGLIGASSKKGDKFFGGFNLSIYLLAIIMSVIVAALYLFAPVSLVTYTVSVIGIFLCSFIIFIVVYRFSIANVKGFSSGIKDILCMAVVLIWVLALLKLSVFISLGMSSGFPDIPPSVYFYVVPVASGAMMISLMLNQESALIFAVISSIFSGLLLGGDLYMAVYFLIGSLVSTMGVRQCIQRSTILKAGGALGGVNIIMIVSFSALKGQIFSPELFLMVISGLAGGLVTAVLVAGITPVFEILFGYTTDIRLLELSRMDHPILKELAMEAPGTYHHSLVIGSMVEAAATEINANPLLARVSAYYHDIGKLKKPDYFIENVQGENRHDKLASNMSALIIISHVKEGIEMARRYKLGEEIINVIQQHHGTSLIRYFYQKAKDLDIPDIHNIKEENFRYPGPKPQTREAGLVMLADAIEAASKTLPDPNAAKIQGMVQKITNRIFTDGQLDECELTLKDLNAIAKSFKRVLNGIFHQRIEYPEPAHIMREKSVENIDTKSAEEKDKGKGDKGNSKRGLKRLG